MFGSWVFADGEDSHALRLANKLADLRAANVNQRLSRGERIDPKVELRPQTIIATPNGVAIIVGRGSWI